jgi:uncharacterized protein YbcI
MAAKKTAKTKQISTMEDVLTTAERKALKKQIRQHLISAVHDELNEVVYRDAEKIVETAIKDLKKDKDFFNEIKLDCEERLKERSKEMAKSIRIYMED